MGPDMRSALVAATFVVALPAWAQVAGETSEIALIGIACLFGLAVLAVLGIWRVTRPGAPCPHLEPLGDASALGREERR